MNRKKISEQYPELLIADGFDKAIIGVSTSFNKMSVAYDTNKCIKILMSRDNMSREEAIEYFEYNVAGAYVGEHTPTFSERWSHTTSSFKRIQIKQMQRYESVLYVERLTHHS